MVVQRFSHGVVTSGLLRFYTAGGFFVSLIFFVVNASLFTPLEILTWVIVSTIAFKGISNVMLSLIILLFSLENKKSEIDFEKTSAEIDAMLAEFSVRETNKKMNK